MTTRRGFLGAMLGAATIAPSIVSAGSLMKLAAPKIIVPRMVFDLGAGDSLTAMMVRDIQEETRRHLEPGEWTQTWWEKPEGGEWRYRVERIDPREVYPPPSRDARQAFSRALSAQAQRPSTLADRLQRAGIIIPVR